MAALKIGTAVKITGDAQIDSLLPVIITATKTLELGIDQVASVDPTIADVILTLPDAASNLGVRFYIKRTVNGGNIVQLLSAGGDTIDGTADGYKLSLIYESIAVYSDGSTEWKIFSADIFSICSMSAASASFAVGTSLAKFTGWDTVVFDTPEKLVGNLTTNVIDVIEFQDTQADGYSVNVTMSFTYTNNNTVTAQLFVNGILSGVPFSVNSFGGGKPVSITIVQQIGVLSATTLELHLSAENAGTINDINAIIQMQRIGR